MAAYNRAPDPINSTFFIPGSNTPGNGTQVFFYSNLSSTKVTVYKDNAGAASWSNPQALDSGGNWPSGGQVYIAAGQTLTIKFAPANDADPPLSPYLTVNDVVGVGDTSSAATEWTLGPTPTFVSSTSFTLVGDQTATFQEGRFVKSTNTGGTTYSRIVDSTFGALTTVTVVNISGVLDSGLSAVSYGLDATNPSFGADHVNRKATAVASAATTNIWGANGDYVHVTGTNTIFSFSSSPFAGSERTVIFDSILSINTSASLLMPGGNITTQANDRALIRSDTASNAIVMFYQRALGGLSAPTMTTLTLSSGTYGPPSGLSVAMVEAVGAGGGSGGCASTGGSQAAGAGGGASGAYAMSIFTASQLGTSVPYTVGQGGSAGGFGNVAGSSGANTIFGNTTTPLLVAPGGGGGNGAANTAVQLAAGGGVPLTGSTGIFNSRGKPGGYGVGLGPAFQGTGGPGGSSMFGGGGASTPTVGSTTGAAGGNYGGGASGSALGQAQTSTTGMPGGAGVIRIVEFY